MRYIHLNPIRAGLAKRAAGYSNVGHGSYLVQGICRIVRRNEIEKVCNEDCYV